MSNLQGKLVGHSTEYVLRCGSQGFNRGLGPSLDRCAGWSIFCWMVDACMKNFFDSWTMGLGTLALVYQNYYFFHYDTSLTLLIPDGLTRLDYPIFSVPRIPKDMLQIYLLVSFVHSIHIY